MVELLGQYDIRLSPAIQTMLDVHLILPGENSAVYTKDVQQRLNQPNSQLELDPEMILILRKSMTLKVLQTIFHDLKLFLEPLLPQLDFLVYFHLQSSEMFHKQLLSRLNKVSPSVRATEMSSIMSLAVDVKQLSTDPAEKLKEVCNYVFIDKLDHLLNVQDL